MNFFSKSSGILRCFFVLTSFIGAGCKTTGDKSRVADAGYNAGSSTYETFNRIFKKDEIVCNLACWSKTESQKVFLGSLETQDAAEFIERNCTLGSVGQKRFFDTFVDSELREEISKALSTDNFVDFRANAGTEDYNGDGKQDFNDAKALDKDRLRQKSIARSVDASMSLSEIVIRTDDADAKLGKGLKLSPDAQRCFSEKTKENILKQAAKRKK